MKKYITVEIIEKQMIKEGYTDDLDETKLYDTVLNWYDAELTSDWKNNLDYMIYSETTADGYEVWVTTEDDRHISVNENVHYYESDLGKYLKDAIQNGGLIQVEGWDNDEFWIVDTLTELYDDVQLAKRDEIINDLIDEGYEYNKKTT